MFALAFPTYTTHPALTITLTLALTVARLVVARYWMCGIIRER